MLLVSRQSRHCLICAKKRAQWLAPPLPTATWLLLPQTQPKSSFSTQPSLSLHITRDKRKPLKTTPKHSRIALENIGSDSRSGLKGIPSSKVTFAISKPLAFFRRKYSKRLASKYAVFDELVHTQFASIVKQMNWKTHLGRLRCEAWGITSEKDFHMAKNLFLGNIHTAIEKANAENKTSAADNTYFYQLRRAFVNGRKEGLARTLQFLFQDMIIEADDPKLTSKRWTNKIALSDIRYPTEWYPATRAMQRTIHLHIGPTNSGKTYHALQRLEAAKTGIYAGPLRLLAHEVYSRMNAKGKLCALITGEERRIPENLTNYMTSCTVEMVPLNTRVEVAVIDEIQMLADEDRGWAWTQAFLGVQADEVHLCGELRTENIIREICAGTGDKLIVHKYERLGPLQVQKRSLEGNLNNLEKGDAIILFSRLAIHAMKKKVEDITGRRCAVVYGSLPPETRAAQAALFNDPNNNYDFLVASDAIGMGLNLSIKRVIFEATSKHDGTSQRLIRIPEIKQIGGRAGRFKTSSDDSNIDQSKPTSPNVGLVTTLEHWDLPIIEKGMRGEAEPITSAGIFPPDRIIQAFASYFPPGTPFSYIVLRLLSGSFTSERFFICTIKDQLLVADIIQSANLTTADRITFMNCPVSLRDQGVSEVLLECAHIAAANADGHLLAMKTLPLTILDKDIKDYTTGVTGYLKDAETLHKMLTLYLWLSYRFVGVFTSQALAFHAKALAEQKIDECLDQVALTKKQEMDLKKQRMKEARKATMEENLKEAAEGKRDDVLVDNELEQDAVQRDDLRSFQLGQAHPSELLKV